MNEDVEIVAIDEDIENLSYLLTLLVKEINPKINLGLTYEILIAMLIDITNDTFVLEDISSIGREINDTARAKPMMQN